MACCLPTTDCAYYHAGLAPPLPGPNPNAPSTVMKVKAACAKGAGCSGLSKKQHLGSHDGLTIEDTGQNFSQEDIFNKLNGSVPSTRGQLGGKATRNSSQEHDHPQTMGLTKTAGKHEQKDRAEIEAVKAWNLRAATRATWEKAYAQSELASSGASGYGRIVIIWVFGLVLATPLVFAATLVLFLPAFFLLLLVRSNTVRSAMVGLILA